VYDVLRYMLSETMYKLEKCFQWVFYMKAHFFTHILTLYSSSQYSICIK
jgi:hypothetical protein